MYKIWSQTVPCIIIIGNLSIMITIFRYESPSLPSIKIFLTSKISYWKILLLHHRLKSVCCKEINISSSIEFHVWNPIEEENLKKNWKLMWCWLNEAKKKEYKKKKKRKNMKCFVQMIYKIETLIVIPRFRLLSSKEDT